MKFTAKVIFNLTTIARPDKTMFVTCEQAKAFSAVVPIGHNGILLAKDLLRQHLEKNLYMKCTVE